LVGSLPVEMICRPRQCNWFATLAARPFWPLAFHTLAWIELRGIFMVGVAAGREQLEVVVWRGAALLHAATMGNSNAAAAVALTARLPVNPIVPTPCPERNLVDTQYEWSNLGTRAARCHASVTSAPVSLRENAPVGQCRRGRSSRNVSKADNWPPTPVTS